MERILVQLRLPRALVKRLDHYRIDHDLTRTDLVVAILTQWLAERAPAAQAAESDQ